MALKKNKEQSNGLGIASLVCGIFSIITPFIGILYAIAGIILAAKQREIHPNGYATAGLTLSIIALVFWLVIAMVVAFLIAWLMPLAVSTGMMQ